MPATVLVWNTGVPSNMESSYVLGARLRGNDTLGLARQGRGGLFHSGKMLPKVFPRLILSTRMLAFFLPAW